MIYWLEKKSLAYITKATIDELLQVLSSGDKKQMVSIADTFVGKSTHLKVRFTDEAVVIMGCDIEEIEDRLQVILEY